MNKLLLLLQLLLLLLRLLSTHRSSVGVFTLTSSRWSFLLTSSLLSSSSSSLVVVLSFVVVRNKKEFEVSHRRVMMIVQQQQQQQQNEKNNNDGNDPSISLFTVPPPNPYEILDNDKELYNTNRMESIIQTYHQQQTPTERLQRLVTYCQMLEEHNPNQMNTIDIYSDWEKSTGNSYIRQFESELASDFGMEDCILMPSGTMAQQIALLVHTTQQQQQQQQQQYYQKEPSSSSSNSYFETDDDTSKQHHNRPTFACHYTSHLLLHEYNAYKELANLNVHIIHTNPENEIIISDSSNNVEEDDIYDTNYHIVPLLYHHIEKAIEDNPLIQVLIIELPHREIGGKVTPYEDLIKIRDLCYQHNIRLHCDGARILEATTAYYDNGISVQQLVSIFDSIYISFYKGLGGLFGCALLGTKSFSDASRIWQKRYGGILYTTLPYAIAAKYGYDTYWKQFNTKDSLSSTDTGSSSSSASVVSFMEKKIRLKSLVHKLTSDPIISKIISFDPSQPETNMIHGYLPYSVEDIKHACDEVYNQTQIQLLHRIRSVPETHPAYTKCGYLSMFEWTMGPANAAITDTTYLYLWYEVALALLKKNKTTTNNSYLPAS